jgi:hypothetical protein
MDWIDLAQERGNEPSGAVKCLYIYIVTHL